MKRRDLLKTLGLSAVGLATVPFWLDAWSTETLPTNQLEVSEDQKKLLSLLVATIIPPTDTPGAVELGVDKFILTMVADCYDTDAQASFKAGFATLDETAKERYAKDFTRMTDEERVELLTELESNSEEKARQFHFVAFLKNLTILGYTSSEYIQKNIMKFELVPSRFHGSFPIENSIYRNA